MKHLSEKNLLKLQKKFRKFKHIQFQNITTNPSVFKQELKMLQCFNIIELKPSNIAKAQWAVINPLPSATEVHLLETSSILAEATDLKDSDKYLKSVTSPWVYIPSLKTAGLFNKTLNKIQLNEKTIIQEPHLSAIIGELQYLKASAIPTLLPTLQTAHTELVKTAATQSKQRGFTDRPAVGDKFRIRAYKDMKKDFGEKSTTIQTEDDMGEPTTLALKLIPSAGPFYGAPFIKMCDSLCNVEGTITGFDSVTGLIKAKYTINDKTVSKITELTDKNGDVTELAEPLAIHESHIERIV